MYISSEIFTLIKVKILFLNNQTNKNIVIKLIKYIQGWYTEVRHV